MPKATEAGSGLIKRVLQQPVIQRETEHCLSREHLWHQAHVSQIANQNLIKEPPSVYGQGCKDENTEIITQTPDPPQKLEHFKPILS